YVMLGPVAEEVHLPDGRCVRLDGDDLVDDGTELEAARHLLTFSLEGGLPVWRHEVEGATIEKRVWMPYHLNTAMARYALVEGKGPVGLVLRPGAHFRPLGREVDAPLPMPFRRQAVDHHIELFAEGALPPLRLALLEAAPTLREGSGSRFGLRDRTPGHRGHAPGRAL